MCSVEALWVTKEQQKTEFMQLKGKLVSEKLQLWQVCSVMCFAKCVFGKQNEGLYIAHWELNKGGIREKVSLL